MARTVTWQIGNYDRDGGAVASTGLDIDTGEVVTSEFIKHATNLKWTIALNGIDQLTFDLYLDDDAASTIVKKQTVIRVWRTVNDPDAGKTLDPYFPTPDFCGLVTGIRKNGNANLMSVTCMSPLWRLQTHFHIDNHRLEVDASSLGVSPYTGGNMDGNEWDQSALMWRLIDMINGAFYASGGDTGIRKPLTRAYNGGTTFWPRTITVAPFFVMKGSYTWPLIFEDLMKRDGSPDIVPEYIYMSDEKDLMYFKTAIVRGSDISGSFSFDYRTGRKNLEDLTMEEQVVPGAYGNFQWVVGDGGPNSGIVDERSNPTDISTNGIYMVRKDVRGTKLADVQKLGPAELKLALANDIPVYTATISAASQDYYGIDYSIGDLVELNADKGALQVSGVQQRIPQVVLSWTDNNVETVDVTLTKDFKGAYA